MTLVAVLIMKANCFAQISSINEAGPRINSNCAYKTYKKYVDVNEDQTYMNLRYGHNTVEMNSQLFRVVNNFSILSDCSSYLDSTEHQIFNIVNSVSIKVVSDDGEQLDYLPQMLLTIKASSFKLEFSEKDNKNFQALSKGKVVLLRSTTEDDTKTLYYQTNYTLIIKKKAVSNITPITDVNDKSISISGLSKFLIESLREGKLDASLEVDKRKRRNDKIKFSYMIYNFSITDNGRLTFEDSINIRQSNKKFYHTIKLRIKPRSPWQLLGDTTSTYNLVY